MDETGLPPVPNVIDAYASQFEAGMVDLSCPSPAPLAFPVSPLEATSLDFATAGGGLRLRALIARLYRHLTPDDILVTSGASEALAALAAAVGGPARRIALADGTYPSMTEVARLIGTEIVADGRLEGVDAVVATNPSVPDGRRVDVAALVSRAVDAGAVPIVDEVYTRIVLDGGACEAAADLDPRAVSIGDLSKPLGLGGLRIGWIATRNHEVREAAASWLRLLTGGPSVVSEALACDALEVFAQHVDGHTAVARRNAPAIYALLRDAGWRFVPAQLGLTVCAYPPRPIGEDALATLRAAGYFLVRGDSFGRPGGFRISLLTAPPVLRQALRQLERARPPERLVVLARIPRRGFGKTRLAASLGAERTHELASAFFSDTLRLAAAGEWRPLLAYTAVEPSEATHVECPIEAVRQTDGDLGARITAALEAALECGGRAVLIGSDTPDLPPAVIERAFAALDHADVVIGPACDGGFYLLGVRRDMPPDPFGGVEWSTDSVYACTLANLEAAGCSVAVLEPWEDIDDLSSVLRLAHRLDAEDDDERAPATRRALAALGIAL